MVFAPLHQEMYPEGTDADLPRLQIGKLGEILEGAFRPGHFQGVALVVAKLFHCVPADRAYFGLKDLQQYMLVRKMAADLFFPVEVIGCPTVRETDGLAMSSRNVRLSTQERKAAPLLYQSLQTARSLLLKGKSLEETKIAAIEMIHQEKLFKLEYFDFVDLSTFKFADNNTSSDRLAACVAAYLGKTRLIDNIPIQP
jgi:pantoate--beta-alanine ligase